MSSEPRDHLTRAKIERVVEVAVFAPVGIALTLRDMAPTFVNMFVSRGRAEIDRHQHAAEQRIQTIRSTGEVALAFGVPMVRQKVSRQIDEWRGRSPDVEPGGEPEAAPDPAGGAESEALHAGIDAAPTADASRPHLHLAAEPTANGTATAVDGPAGPSAGDLAIPGYDELAASQVVERLVGLDGAELAAVRDYESAHRNRRTILGKIDQLTG